MTTMTATRFLRTLRNGSLVGSNVRSLNLGNFARVQHRQVLDNDSLDPSLADAGWRLADWEGGFGRIFVRPTDFVMIGNSEAVRVESREVDTSVVETEDGFAIVASLGANRSPMIARRDSIHLEPLQ